MAEMARGLTFLVLLLLALAVILKGGERTTNRHLEMGDKMVAAGRFTDALADYHRAVEMEPDNYRVYYQRAKVYLEMNRVRSAARDLDKVVHFKPHHKAARLMRGDLKMKMCDLDAATADYKEVLVQEPSNAEAKNALKKMKPPKKKIMQAKDVMARGGYKEAIRILNPIILMCPFYVETRDLRASCFEATGDLKKAIDDLQASSKLRIDNTERFYKLSRLYYMRGNPDDSLIQIRECLRLDPDHKACHEHYVKVKTLVRKVKAVSNLRDEERWEECTDKADEIYRTEPHVLFYKQRANEHKCYCHTRARDYDLGLTICSRILKTDKHNIDGLSGRAELHMIDGEHHTAVAMYREVEELAGNLSWVQDGLRRAEHLLMQSPRIDHYQVLGVNRNANKKQIMKAYRKLAFHLHPDRCQSTSLHAATIHRLFYDITEAKEILGDPNRRASYDHMWNWF